ncbi:ATP-dependent DNA helicase RecG [Cyanobacterium aponinum UTEX 3222]|uniref:ATP-dependent DNA helicase RecG n=1 Tax=Cyanobacterium aponinum AL20115 TaxID=3090662 RepID=A0AAF1C2J5_9CHRO|nr:ATP-dependent DNA helicase RecG [Cyanobacterium aponinum]MBD2395443.1 ATP-dependent DNA helicase RecG [Cyanobacterium aponinum FACHB-4101]PHV63515.1 ATP-dependent DNA helicase RecG [Cyanobacterium aponinum IPPAS B-1201]WPF89767.1 ATP-dependent DNA helicase RecG [Cyanobacterium aponinum AL20115]WRL41575.1 ATP-dependent DNA helicase RecG [Cyanobacterium aponinum UTEX 3222]
MSRINPEKFDWERIEKALQVESEYGYKNIQGKLYRFSEFLCLTFGETPPVTNLLVAFRWQETAKKFARYSHLTILEREDLINQTLNLIGEVKEMIVNKPYYHPVAEEVKSLAVAEVKPPSNTSVAPVTLKLDDPVTLLKAISLRQGELLKKLQIVTIRDLLFYYPRDHIDYGRQVNIKDLVAGETVTIVGKIKKCDCFSSPKNKKLTIFSLIIIDRTGEVKISRFFAGNFYSNRGWQEKMKRQFPRNAIVAASGLVKQNKYGITLENPEFEVLNSQGGNINSLKIGRLLPVYPLTDGIPADVIRNGVMEAMVALPQISDPLPVILKQQYGLMELQEAIARIHYPEDQDQLSHARRRLIFDEFFYLQLGFLQRRQEQKESRIAVSFTPNGRLIEEFNQILPFSLTNAQKRVIEEIIQDLQSPSPMNRLVQGDVGAGKTIVAVFAILTALQSGYQGALMAPTEVLAEQHYRKIVGWFNLLHLPVELLTGSTKTAKRRQIHGQLESGELPLLIGTHALIQDPVQFRNLGLVVIDEQHRFGVQQRAKLLSKGRSPHVLSMTATPIPRTLALTLHGDLDVSQIDELPPGRQPIQTTVLTGKQRPQAYELIKREVAQGRQAYVIFPLIEESEKLDVKAAIAEYEKFSEKIFPNFNVGLLHGRMSSADKDKALNAFRDNETQIIVSTTVIEVGVDVPNATVMLIENAERFGLSQLHQLRGRVGRGSHKSFCLLVTSSKTPDSIQRLNVLEQSQDGFFISEMDLRLRGPGEVLGSRQSGLPDFALASLVEDQEVLVLAREAAEKILLQDKYMQGENSLKDELQRRYQKLIGNEILT